MAVSVLVIVDLRGLDMVTVLAVATMISLTNSGAKSPWALTPGVRLKVLGQFMRAGDVALVIRRVRLRRDWARRRAESPSPSSRSVACSPNGRSSRGIGAWNAATGFEESAMTTNRRAARRHDLLSQLCTATTLLTSQPSGAI